MGGGEGPERWTKEHRFFRRGTGTIYRKLQSLKFLLTRDLRAVSSFLAAHYPFDFPRSERVEMLSRFIHITNELRGYHTLAEILTVCDRLFRRATPGRKLTLIECGAGSGSSSAKLSLAAKRVGAELLVFDSFQGIPDNEEQHQLLDGRRLVFRRGAFKGRLTSVKQRVEKYGASELCTFHKGLFEETLPGFARPIDVVLLDVDLISSTKTCVTRLYPHLTADGVLFSQDGHLRATVDLFSDHEFWRSLGVQPPRIEGLGKNKMLELKR
jgi:O-methyltransferase